MEESPHSREEDVCITRHAIPFRVIHGVMVLYPSLLALLVDDELQSQLAVVDDGEMHIVEAAV